MQQNIDLSENYCEKATLLYKCFEPTLAQLGLVVPRQTGSQQGRGFLPSVRDIKGCLLNLQETSSKRERKTEKTAYGVKQASQLVSVSLFVSVYVSSFDGDVFPVQVDFCFSPK